MKRELKQVFGARNPYRHEETGEAFLKAMQAAVTDFWEKSGDYREICRRTGFHPDELQTMEDLAKIPAIPTLYFKRNDIRIPHPFLLEVTSSGTSGQCSRVGYSAGEIAQMAKMAIRLGRIHGLFSVKPVHYVMLGYQPNRRNETVISKTAYLSTWYAPALSRTYALPFRDGEYRLDLEALFEKLVRCSEGRMPVRIVGFPSYAYFLLLKMKKEGRRCLLPAGSMVLLGGGWKQFADLAISKEELSALFEEVLGIPAGKIHEFFGAAEHPVLYCTCEKGHFHVPAYGRVIIRDVETLEPLPPGQAGLVNLLTPMTASLPLMSVMTDDLGILHPAEECGCGNPCEYLEILGRVGARGVQTCSAGAQRYWGQEGKKNAAD